MRSQSVLYKSHSLVKRTRTFHVHLPLKARGSCPSRSARWRTFIHERTHIRSLSTTSDPPFEPDADSTTATPTQKQTTEGGPAAEGVHSVASPLEDAEKAPIRIRRTRASASSKDATASSSDSHIEFRQGLENEIFLVPTETNPGLLPSEIFEEALDKLLITLHPENQARSMLPPSGSNRPIEPTLGLYCPIEGGDIVVDYTVVELAFHTGSEVLVLDAVQLAAGEWGMFGKPANALNLSPNPLHFSPNTRTPSPESSRRSMIDEVQEEAEAPVILAAPSRMSISLPKSIAGLPSRMVMAPGSRKPSSPSKLDLFFDALVNIPCPEHLGGSSLNQRPRLIYIRDFPTLAPSSSSWYPSLLNAVRQRRRGRLARSSNTTSSPVAIIFGMSPSIAHPSHDSSPSPRSSLMSLFMNPYSMPAQSAKSEPFQDFSESENAQMTREKRLLARLRKWEKNPAALQEEYPKLQTKPVGGVPPSVPDIFVIGGPQGPPSMQPAGMTIGVSVPDEDRSAQFFRSTVLVPLSRSLFHECQSRMLRRREINELTMRMGVGAIGGVIDSSPAFPDSELPENPSDLPKSAMWEAWGNRIEPWSNVRKIADRAVGSVMVQQRELNDQERPSLTPTVVPWSAVQSAWSSCDQLRDLRSIWLKEFLGDKLLDSQEDGKDSALNAPGSTSDKVVENLKNDPDLDQHEARLLSCIVDSNSLMTTFSHVHLPSQTIDAIRTIVSLPLLHPQAFQQGLLKEHGMTGCLLFGPPGTGKTLAVRALAKEAGCRMLVISPSDVMDMYVGEGEKLVRAVFSLARKLSPCVVFLDEIDAIFGARWSARESGNSFVHRGVITEFMQEMDGLKSSRAHNVIVIGATNRPFDLDDAVLRRLPRRLLVDLPGEKEREEILKILLRDEALASDVNVAALAKKTDGFSGSDLKHLCVSAALDSVKEHIELPWVSHHSHTPAAVPELKPTPLSAKREEIRREDGNAVSVVAGDQTVKENVERPELNLGMRSSLKSGKVETDEIGKENVERSELTLKLQSSETSLASRILHLRHFTQALKEITPSSSEALGSLADLRKWNEEFGEGRRRRHVWGKGSFGFVDGQEAVVEDGRVAR